MPAVPGVIQRFVDATNAGDTKAFLDCFSADASLNDWGREFTGRDGVASWNETDNVGVHSQLKIVRSTTDGPGVRLTVAVSGGGFNGEGTMTFTLAGDRITRLEIT